MPKRFPWSGVVAVLLLASPGVARGADLVFNRDVRPILSEHCFHCHGPDRETRAADLRLDLSDSLSWVVEAGEPDESELIRRIHSDDEYEQMPPPQANRPLSDSQKQTLVRWVAEGANFQQHWAFLPPVPQPIPSPTDDNWSRNPIDRFVLQKMRQHGLSPSPRASRETLLRRIGLDLNGLPPTPEALAGGGRKELELELDDWIRRCFDSPRYGEHMAVTWLEAARYADTDGYQNDRYRHQHVWRDWVIEAMNDKMPYDQFVIEQLAGDLLPDATLKQQIATGFGRNHRINSEDGSIPQEWLTENVVDRVDTFGTVFLGLTVGCARCHDHKYDPISQKEYYQLFAYFNNIAEWGVGPNDGNSPPFVEVPPSWPDLSPEQNQFVTPEPVRLRSARKEAGNGLKRPQAGSPSTVMVMHELEEPRETFVLSRGQYDQPDRSQPVEPAVPGALASGLAEQPADRLELARWLFRDDHPLTARVAVNRIWQHFFGAGLVETSDNLGSQGSLPTHPELLDWLATELIRSDWNVQAIQRLILDSATYQQSSTATPELLEIDPGNRWLARGPRFRLPAFTLRDQALAAGGLLTERIGGRSVKPYMPKGIWASISNNRYKQDDGGNLFRRSLYTYWRRTIPPPTMVNFNAAAREVCTVRNERTNTPLQALTLMNHPTFVESARGMAERMLRHGGDDLDAALRYGFRLVCVRGPSPQELDLLRRAHADFHRQYQSEPAAAEDLLAIGQSPRDRQLEPVSHAAMTLAASMILNLDEAVTKE